MLFSDCEKLLTGGNENGRGTGIQESYPGKLE
jgi:hypothetical protein